MENSFAIPSWQEATRRLIAVAAGREPADLVVRGCTWVNVQTRETLPEHDIAIAEGRFAYCGTDASHCVGEETLIIEADGMYAVPGLCDGHMHIESGMLTPARFAEAVIPHGTTSMFADPHEIANVLGLRGVKLMHDEAVIQPINIFLQMPSCVPSAPGLETAGSTITPRDVVEAMQWPGMVGLGEMMNFPGVIAGDEGLLAEMAATRDAGKTVGGHYASRDLGPDFHAYVAGGPADDHEGTLLIDAVSRARQGMRSMMRLGSAWHDVQAQIAAVTEHGLDPRNFILCTDDCHSGTLVNDGHMNRVVRHAIDCGCDPLIALQMATINTASHFGLEREIGSISPGRRADMILTSCLRSLPIERVIARGRTLALKGQIEVDTPHLDWPDFARSTTRLVKPVVEPQFRIRAPSGDGQFSARVIGVIENQAPTHSLVAHSLVAPVKRIVSRGATLAREDPVGIEGQEPTRLLATSLTVRRGIVEADGASDVCQVSLVDRYGDKHNVNNALVTGFGYTGPMAVASSIAHDCHHLIVVGTDRNCMAQAVNRLAETGGGACVWRGDEELANIRLPIAGLMSDRPAAEVAAEADALNRAISQCGCSLNNAFMQHTLLALAVIPELRITNLGLVDVVQFKTVPLFEDNLP